MLLKMRLGDFTEKLSWDFDQSNCACGNDIAEHKTCSGIDSVMFTERVALKLGLSRSRKKLQ